MSTRPEPFLKSLAPADTCLNASAPHDGHVSCWQAGDAVPMPDGLSAAAFQEEDLSIREMKGLNTANVSFELYAANHPLWLVFSFIGPFYVNQRIVAHPEHYTGCSLGTR